jgi:DNA-binding CsgD family transcriptional regulator
MKQGYEALSEKEKQTLRLLLAGHEAKSMARQLGLSVHTINERLRDARRKLSASSSKEAARMLRQAEGAGPESFGDEAIGGARTGPVDPQGDRPNAGSSARRRMAAWAIGGLAMIAFALAALAWSASPHSPPDRPEPRKAASRPAPVAESAVTQAARQWLALVDAGNWPESWAATAPSFQSLNTLEMWRSASEGGRVPLGRVLSRRLAGQEGIPAPPNGYQLVRFRTDFANKPGATETLSLAREGESWKVAGYYIE